MAYTGGSRPRDHTQFGGGPGLIDPERRKDRVVGQEATATGYGNMGEELWEIYATNPAQATSEPETAPLDPPHPNTADL